MEPLPGNVAARPQSSMLKNLSKMLLGISHNFLPDYDALHDIISVVVLFIFVCCNFVATASQLLSIVTV